jgi:hypothetical protein
MSNKQILALVILVGAYYYWTWKHRTGSKINVKTGMIGRGKRTYSANAFKSSASTMPTSQSLTVPGTRPTAGWGNGFFLSPTQGMQKNNAPGRSSGVGSIGRQGLRSRRKWGIGTLGIAPVLPTTQVLPTRTVLIGSGAVQVPSYAAIPVTTRSPGGGGSVLWGGR